MLGLAGLPPAGLFMLHSVHIGRHRCQRSPCVLCPFVLHFGTSLCAPALQPLCPGAPTGRRPGASMPSGLRATATATASAAAAAAGAPAPAAAGGCWERTTGGTAVAACGAGRAARRRRGRGRRGPAEARSSSSSSNNNMICGCARAVLLPCAASLKEALGGKARRSGVLVVAGFSALCCKVLLHSYTSWEPLAPSGFYNYCS